MKRALNLPLHGSAAAGVCRRGETLTAAEERVVPVFIPPVWQTCYIECNGEARREDMNQDEHIPHTHTYVTVDII